MSLESIRDLKEVSCGGKISYACQDMGVPLPNYLNSSNNIVVDDDIDMIAFRMMTKPVSEGGKGCQFTDLIEVALHQLQYLDKKFPCAENKLTINHLCNALRAQSERTRKRTKRGVEGKDEL